MLNGIVGKDAELDLAKITKLAEGSIEGLNKISEVGGEFERNLTFCFGVMKGYNKYTWRDIINKSLNDTKNAVINKLSDTRERTVESRRELYWDEIQKVKDFNVGI